MIRSQRRLAPSITGNERGSGFLLALAVMAVIVLCLGAAIDLGYLYLVQQELRSVAESKALAAAHELDGTWNGIHRARALVAENNPPVGDLQITTEAEFSSEPGAGFTTEPRQVEGMRHVRVRANTNTRLFFMPLIPGVKPERKVAAVATAGLVRMESAGPGIMPLAPQARDPESPEFGFKPGELYALNPSSSDTCNGSQQAANYSVAYLNVGQRADSGGLRDVVVNGSYYRDELLKPGVAIAAADLPDNLQAALSTRYLQDTDTVSTRYDDYLLSGNGRRLLTLPVSDGSDPARVTGFGVFLLQPNTCSQPGAPCCAAYIGSSSVVNGRTAGHGPAGVYEIRLLGRR